MNSSAEPHDDAKPHDRADTGMLNGALRVVRRGNLVPQPLYDLHELKVSPTYPALILLPTYNRVFARRLSYSTMRWHSVRRSTRITPWLKGVVERMLGSGGG